jgi:hypothetical protein
MSSERLGGVVAPPRVTRLMVTRQDEESRRYERIGVLSFLDDGYEFRYDVDPASQVRPLVGFDDLDRTYRSRHLFPLFDERVASPRRPDYDQWLSWLGLPDGEVHPMEFLARSGGRRRGDRIELIPLSEPDALGIIEQLCLVHGVRHVEGAEDVLATLRPGDPVELRPDPQNEHNPMALKVVHGRPFGYVPDPLLELVTSLSDRHARVVHVNGPEAGTHMRCLIEISGRVPS